MFSSTAVLLHSLLPIFPNLIPNLKVTFMLISIQRSLVSQVSYTNGDLGEGLSVGTLFGVDGQMAQLCAGDVAVQDPLNFSAAALKRISAA